LPIFGRSPTLGRSPPGAGRAATPGDETEGRLTFPRLGRLSGRDGDDGLWATAGRETGFPAGADGLDIPIDGRGAGEGAGRALGPLT
jgi:hypothetical protein